MYYPRLQTTFISSSDSDGKHHGYCNRLHPASNHILQNTFISSSDSDFAKHHHTGVSAASNHIHFIQRFRLNPVRHYRPWRGFKSHSFHPAIQTVSLKKNNSTSVVCKTHFQDFCCRNSFLFYNNSESLDEMNVV